MKYRASFVRILFPIIFTLIGHAQLNDFAVLKGPYLGQKPPGKKAELFAPGVITYEVHESPSISPDEKEILIGSFLGQKVKICIFLPRAILSLLFSKGLDISNQSR